MEKETNKKYESEVIEDVKTNAKNEESNIIEDTVSKEIQTEEVTTNNEQDSNNLVDQILEKESEKEKEARKRDKKDKFFTEIEGYGYHYSFKEFIMRLVILWAVIGVAAYFYRMQIIPIILLVILSIAIVPFMIKAQMRYKYEHDKFAEVSNYLKQITNSFLKSKKIRDSLFDTSEIMRGTQIRRKLLEAVDYLDHAQSDNIYEEAFAIIEEEYGCEKMKGVHEFFIKIEKEGGPFEDTLVLMQQDVDEWVERTYSYQARRSSVQKMMLITIIISLFLTGILTAFLPTDIHVSNNASVSLDFTKQLAYQISSTIYLGIMVMFYLLSYTVMQGSWLVDKGIRKDKEIIKDYRTFTDYDFRGELIKSLLFSLAFIAVGAAAYFFMHQQIMGIIIGLCGVYYLFEPKRKPKRARKRLTRDIEKAFPSWVRDVSISLNNHTVHNAITLSLEKTPTVMKPAVKKLIDDFTEDPVSYEPWGNFLAEYDVPEAHSAARMFYSINELSGETAKEQINALIKRNIRSVREADEKKADDEISFLGYMVALPMLVGIFKLIIDLFCLLGQFSTTTGEIMSRIGQ